MPRAVGIAIVIAAVLLLLLGGLSGGVFFVLAMVTVVLVAFGFLASRGRNRPPGPRSVIEHAGVQWMKDPNGHFLRWDTAAEEWKQSAPPAPEVIAKFDAAAVQSPPGWRGARSALVVTLTVVVIIGLALWAAVDPHAQIPVFSRLVCNLKGASWHEGSSFLGIPPGCYAREAGSFLEESEVGTGDARTVAALDASLKNAATAQESYATGGAGYTSSVEVLREEGLIESDGVVLDVVISSFDYYCMEATDGLGTVRKYSSDVGTPQVGYC